MDFTKVSHEEYEAESNNKPLTAEEKSERLREYCFKRAKENSCNETCPLYGIIPVDEYCYTLNDGKRPCNIDRNYEIIFGNEAADSIRQSEDKEKPNIPSRADEDVDAMTC